MALTLVLILIAGINFSLLIPVNKIAGDAGMPNFAYVFWYALGAGLILLVPATVRRELPQLTLPHIRLYFVSATLGFAFPFALLAFVATKLPSGVTVLLLTLTPVFTYALAVLFRLDRFRRSARRACWLPSPGSSSSSSRATACLRPAWRSGLPSRC